jgi:hypothetical protein
MLCGEGPGGREDLGKKVAAKSSLEGHWASEGSNSDWSGGHIRINVLDGVWRESRYTPCREQIFPGPASGGSPKSNYAGDCTICGCGRSSPGSQEDAATGAVTELALFRR